MSHSTDTDETTVMREFECYESECSRTLMVGECLAGPNAPPVEEWEVILGVSDDGSVMVMNVYCSEHTLNSEIFSLREKVDDLFELVEEKDE